jgi:hypothetical protein
MLKLKRWISNEKENRESEREDDGDARCYR